MSGSHGSGDPNERDPPHESPPGTPAATSRRPVDERLTFERQPFARWTGHGMYLRILAMLLLRWKRKHLRQWVPPILWSMILLAWILMTLLALLALGVGLLAGYLATPVGG